MDLYHLHLKNNHDNLYREGNEFIVNDNNYNNRLFYKAMDLTPSVQTSDYQHLVDFLNFFMVKSGYQPYKGLVPLNNVIETAFRRGFDEATAYNLLYAAKKKMADLEFFIRERAMEDYRKENLPELPSRLHSLFATHEAGLPYWINNILDGDLDIYRIDVEKEPFVSNANLLPDENLSYAVAYQLSSRYFKPKQKYLDDSSNEYLVQGKVRILEKVGEIKRSK